MANFVERLTAPERNNPYYYQDNVFYQSGYGLPNCTCYAWGRWYELLKEKPRLCLGNASDWYYYTEDGYKRGNTPSLGDIICFINTQDPTIGHVAVVEKIYSDGSILTSNSDYGGRLFYLLKLNTSYYLGDNYKFLGFIKNPINYGENNGGGNNPNKEEFMDYTIKYGDTLTSIANMFGTTYEYLAKINNIPNPNIIYAGQTIKVPKGNNNYTPKEYIVKEGDTLSQIAAMYGTTYQRLAEINGIENPNLIYPGQVIKIF